MRTATSVIAMLLVVACGSAGAPGGREFSLQVVADGQFAHVQAPSLSIAVTEVDQTRLSILAGKPLGGELLIAIFMGERSTGGYAVRVDGASVAGSEVRVRGSFLGPPPGGIVTQVITSPFAIASIDRSQLPTGQTTFVFVDGGTILARAEVVLP